MDAQGTTETARALDRLKVAVLVTDGFEQSELLEPKRALEAAGARVDVISDHQGTVQGYRHLEKGMSVKVDKPLGNARAEDYAGVLLPGGVANGDAMRIQEKAQDFIRQMDRAKKPIAAICHGGWLLISAGIAARRTLTSWPSMKDDFENAGSTWIDEEVVRDDNLVSSRKPDDIPAFNDAFISLLRSEKANVMLAR
ncbi:MAG TPA: type 1 glutamine amidotransferase domain-containing protein [Burkholderiaceae bacterium]